MATCFGISLDQLQANNHCVLYTIGSHIIYKLYAKATGLCTLA